MIYEMFSLQIDVVSRDKQDTSVHCERVARIKNCDYNEETGLPESILVLFFYSWNFSKVLYWAEKAILAHA
jgi:hypothetical protein